MTSSKQIQSLRSLFQLLRRGMLILALTLVVVGESEAQAVPEGPPRRARNMRTVDYPKPMRFDVIGDGVTLGPLMIDYDLSESGGRSLQLGNVKFDETTFYATLVPANRLDPKLFKVLPKNSAREWVFAVAWPENMVTEGVLEMISRTGRVLWSYDIVNRDLEYWAAQQDLWKSILLDAKYKIDEIQRSPLFYTQFGIRDVRNSNTPFWSIEESFRFCLTSKKGAGQTRLCTAQYQVRRKKDLVKLEFVPRSQTPARVILFNESAPLKKLEPVKIGKPVQFFAELSTGASYEYFATPHNFKLVEMTEVKGTQRVFVVGEGEFPLQKVRVVREETVGALTELIGWQQTIGELKRYWEAEISRDKSFVMIPGDGGGVFRQDFEITKLPREEIRPYMERRTIDATYVDGPKVFVQKAKSLTASSEMNSAETDEDDKTKITWRFGSPQRGQYNRSYLLLNDGENTYKAYHEIYKGYPRELSARLTGAVGSNSNYVLSGELAFNYWFEDIFGWTQYYLSRQRWGFSGKYYMGLTPIKTPMTIQGVRSVISSEIVSATADLKYRLDPGLWNRDESWGLIAGYQQVKYDFFDVPMIGAGFFWARSMPKVFDDFFNIAKFMRYPKWVDMEFIYYLNSLKSDQPLRTPFNTQGAMGNWALNFHGKVLWGENVFGEAGFGIRQYDFNKLYSTGAVRTLNFKFTSFYGTAGIGISF